MPTSVVPADPIKFVTTSIIGTVSSAGARARSVSFTFTWRRDLVALAVSKTAVLTEFQARVAVPIAAALNIRYTQIANTIRVYNDATSGVLRVPLAAPLIGSINGDSQAAHNAVAITRSTGLKGPCSRSAVHLSPLSESDTTILTDDVLNVAALARFTTVAAAILAGFTDATGNIWVPVVVGGLHVAPPVAQIKVNPVTITWALVISSIVQSRIGTMVRRKSRAA